MRRAVNIRFERILLLALLALLAVSRFTNLGTRPLSDVEAIHALNASVGTQGASEFWNIKETPTIRSPLYQVATHLLFQVFGPEEAIARIVPAIAGFLLLLLVVFFWKEGTQRSKILWLSLLGFSPIVLTASRNVNGDILAAAALVGVLLLLVESDLNQHSNPELGFSIALGIAFAAGSAIYKALTGIVIVFIVVLVISRVRREQRISLDRLQKLLKSAWLVPVTALVISSGFGSSPETLQGIAFGLEEWLLGWVQPSGYSALELILLLFTTEPLILIFGVVGAVRLWGNRKHPGHFAAYWALGAFSFIAIYQGRTPLDLIWLILPLSYLAVQAIQELIISLLDMRSNRELLGLIALLITFTASAALSIVAYGSGNVLTINPGNPNLILLLFLALGIMGLSVLVFFGIGWSWSIVIQAIGILAIILTLSLGISSIWRLNFTQESYHVQELWWQVTPGRAMPLMISSLENAALAFSGHRHVLPIELQDEPSPSFAWALRNFQLSEAETAFGAEATPVVLALDTNQEVDLPADYIGQSFGIRELRAWDTVLPPDIFRWWISREVPTVIEQWVLWLRVDIASFGEIELGS